MKIDSSSRENMKTIKTTKRVRNFQDSWLRQFPWLEYHLTNGKGKMYCQFCRKYDSVGSFSTGSDNFKLESIKCHEKSKSHVKYAAICQAKEKSTSDSTAAKTLMTINKHVVERISNMFRIAHSLAKHGRPYTFDKIPSLDWRRLNCFRSECPSLLDLVDLILTLPSSSVEAERGFSYMKIVKTDWRSRLSDTSLSDLLIVQLESPSIQAFNPEKSVTGWMAGGKRRPLFVQTEDPKEVPVLVDDTDVGHDVQEQQQDQDVDDDVIGELEQEQEASPSDVDEGFLDEYSDCDEDLEHLSVHENRAYMMLKTHLISQSD